MGRAELGVCLSTLVPAQILALFGCECSADDAGMQYNGLTEFNVLRVEGDLPGLKAALIQ